MAQMPVELEESKTEDDDYELEREEINRRSPSLVSSMKPYTKFYSDRRKNSNSPQKCADKEHSIPELRLLSSLPPASYDHSVYSPPPPLIFTEDLLDPNYDWGLPSYDHSVYSPPAPLVFTAEEMD